MACLMVSACLLGIRCRYDGASKPDRSLLEQLKFGYVNTVLPVCPEQLGGLPTPRPPAAIYGGDGFDVIEERAKVLLTLEAGRKAGRDVTSHFLKGAEECLRLARMFKVTQCILKARSPSCGLYPLAGVTAARLITAGFQVSSAG